MKKLLAITTFLILLFSITSHSKVKFVFPSGWRPAEKMDYLDEDLLMIENIVPNRADGDFNGDGFNDTALLLINDTEKKYSLLVYLYQKKGGYKKIKLEEGPKISEKLHNGISLMEPGNYKTACGKGYWDCEPGEPAVLTLKNPGIACFEFESSSSVFYWDTHKREFKQIWMSD